MSVANALHGAIIEYVADAPEQDDNDGTIQLRERTLSIDEFVEQFEAATSILSRHKYEGVTAITLAHEIVQPDLADADETASAEETTVLAIVDDMLEKQFTIVKNKFGLLRTTVSLELSEKYAKHTIKYPDIEGYLFTPVLTPQQARALKAWNDAFSLEEKHGFNVFEPRDRIIMLGLVRRIQALDRQEKSDRKW